MTTIPSQPTGIAAPTEAPDSPELAVRCVGIEKSFGADDTRIRVLRGTDFTAESGRMNFLVGPSGCGKTTLISVIGAILKAKPASAKGNYLNACSVSSTMGPGLRVDAAELRAAA